MFPIPLKPGLFVELEAHTGEGHAHYLSRIVSLEPHAIEISAPRSLNGQQANLVEGASLFAGVITESGSYGFSTRILGRQDSPEQRLLLEPPGEVCSWQRQYLRVDARVWIHYRTIATMEMAGSTQRARRAFTQTLNISGGGLLMQAEEDLPVGTLMELEIDLPSVEEPILALGRIVHAASGQGVEFLLIDEPDREAIIRYIFECVRTSRHVGRSHL